MKKTFRATIMAGKIRMRDPEAFRTYVSGLRQGREVWLTIGEPEHDRSLAQNGYYFGVVVSELADKLGYLKDEMHEILRAKFLKSEKTIKGKRYEFVRSTASLTTKEFEDYLEQCRAWALSEHELAIPLPNEYEIKL